MPVDVVWFKKDLRARDHAPLVSASLSGSPVICLFMLEPGRLELDDTDPIHIQWELDCAVELSATLRDSGADLHFAVGDAVSILEELNQSYGIERLLSHEETGNSWSFERDRRVLKWSIDKGIEWLEWPHNGVVRRLKSRDDWKR
ncbi:MAG TPA: deoxyribodipyrimidine photo-lyase, partial [Candidatus Thalassarchaeaceae archaeon]